MIQLVLKLNEDGSVFYKSFFCLQVSMLRSTPARKAGQKTSGQAAKRRIGSVYMIHSTQMILVISSIFAAPGVSVAEKQPGGSETDRVFDWLGETGDMFFKLKTQVLINVWQKQAEDARGSKFGRFYSKILVPSSPSGGQWQLALRLLDKMSVPCREYLGVFGPKEIARGQDQSDSCSLLVLRMNEANSA